MQLLARETAHETAQYEETGDCVVGCHLWVVVGRRSSVVRRTFVSIRDSKVDSGLLECHCTPRAVLSAIANRSQLRRDTSAIAAVGSCRLSSLIRGVRVRSDEEVI